MQDVIEMVSEDSVVVQVPALSIADVGGEAVVLNLNTGKYHGLNEVGKAILEMISEARAVSEIVATLQAEYEAPREEISEAVLGFLRKMEERDLIQVIDASVGT